MLPTALLFILIPFACVFAGPVHPRAVQFLDQAAFQQAQQRDETADRAFSDIQIQTSDGKCLGVDELSGDYRANLTPIQVVECGSTNGQGWDIITAGKHNDQSGRMLVVSSLTQACFNVDPRRPVGSQVFLFSCGGRADGSGQVTNSQLFEFNHSSGPLRFQPQNANGRCLFVTGNFLGIQACISASQDQSFTFARIAGSNTTSQPVPTQGSASLTVPVSAPTSLTSSARLSIQTVFVTVTPAVGLNKNLNGATTSSSPQTTNAPSAITLTASSTLHATASRDGAVLNPSAAADSNHFDSTATRVIRSANVRAPDGRCLSINPMAGDSRQNLIPVQLAECRDDPNQKFDVLTKGEHNDGTAGNALIVSVLTNGCLSFDGRRQAGDTVNLFFCGGRADGGGDTNAAQLYPFSSTSSQFAMKPLSEQGETCLIAGSQRVESAACDGAEKESIFDIAFIV